MVNTVLLYILFFFFYSAAGWLGESIYCSVPARKWINRGFLTGPMCPIYGSGALLFAICLGRFSQLKFYADLGGTKILLTPIFVFFLGALLADILEFLTSIIMEKIFHARWWDYSNKKFNIQGRICLTHTIYWGIAAVVFLYLIHPFVSGLFEAVPIFERNAVCVLVLVIFFIDLIRTVGKAADFRKMYDKMEYYSKLFREKGNAALDILGGKTEELREQIDTIIAQGRQLYDETKESSEALKEQITEKARKSKAKISRFLRVNPDFRKRVTARFEEFREQVEKYFR